MRAKSHAYTRFQDIRNQKMQVHEAHYEVEELLNNPSNRAVVDEIIAVLKDLPVPFYEGKSFLQKKLCIVHPLLNTCSEKWFELLGWQLQAKLSKIADIPDNGSFDFLLETSPGLFVAVEMQLGNGGRSPRDREKLEQLHHAGKLQFAVVISFTRETANHADSGLAMHETLCRHAEQNRFKIPTVLLGLDARESEIFDVAKIPGLTFATSLGGKGSGALRDFVAQAMLDRKNPETLQLPDEILAEVQALEKNEIRSKVGALSYLVDHAVRAQATPLLIDAVTEIAELLKKVRQVIPEAESELKKLAA